MKNFFMLIHVSVWVSSTVAQTPDESKAKTLATSGKTTEALSAYEKIVEKTPNNISAISAMGELYLKAERYLDAYATATGGLKISKLNDNLHIIKAKAALSCEKIGEAIALMDLCIARKPGNYLFHSVKGNALDANNEVHQAICAYTKSIDLNPKYIPNYIDRGNDFYYISRNEQAMTDFTKVIEAEPKNGKYYNLRGLCLVRLNRSEEAINDFNKAIELNYLYALVNRGQYYGDRNNTEKALEDYKKAVSELPDFPDGYYGLALTYIKLKNWNLAAVNIRHAILLADDRSHYYAEYAYILIALDKNVQAIDQADMALKLNDKNPNGYIYKTIALSNLERYEEAEVVITKGITEYPENYVLYLMRANVYNQMGKKSLADADNAKAKEFGVR
jgi:tetratricopeptide (TPR) repeat protein